MYVILKCFLKKENSISNSTIYAVHQSQNKNIPNSKIFKGLELIVCFFGGLAGSYS